MIDEEQVTLSRAKTGKGGDSENHDPSVDVTSVESWTHRSVLTSLAIASSLTSGIAPVYRVQLARGARYQSTEGIYPPTKVTAPKGGSKSHKRVLPRCIVESH